MGWFSKTPEEEQYEYGRQKMRAIQDNPELSKLFYEQIRNKQREQHLTGLMGQEETPANYESQTIMEEGPMLPNQERQPMTVNQLGAGETEAQEAQEGSGILGGKMSPTEKAMRMMMAPDKESRAVGGSIMQQIGKPEGRRTTFEMGAPNGMVQRAYLGDDGNAVSVGDPYRAFAPNAPSTFTEKMNALSSDDPDVVANAKTAMRGQWDDVGTGKRNRVTGEFIPKDVAGVEVDKKVGQSVGNRLASYDGDQKTSRDARSSAKDLNAKLEVLFDKTTDWGSTGLTGKAMSMIWGTDAADWETTKDTIVSNIALDKLLEMKASSPTGASGFGALSERELRLLESNIASLEQAQSPEQARRNIRYIQSYTKRLQKTLAEDEKRREQWYKTNSRGRTTAPIYSRGETEPRAPSSSDTAPNGVKWAE